jgi:hypothetical protein
MISGFLAATRAHVPGTDLQRIDIRHHLWHPVGFDKVKMVNPVLNFEWMIYISSIELARFPVDQPIVLIKWEEGVEEVETELLRVPETIPLTNVPESFSEISSVTVFPFWTKVS